MQLINDNLHLIHIISEIIIISIVGYVIFKKTSQLGGNIRDITVKVNEHEDIIHELKSSTSKSSTIEMSVMTDTNKQLQTHMLQMEQQIINLTNQVDMLSSIVNTPRPPPRQVVHSQPQPRQVVHSQPPPRQVVHSPPPQQVEQPPPPPRQVEQPPQQVEQPPPQVEQPPQQVEHPPPQVEQPPRQVEQSITSDDNVEILDEQPHTTIEDMLASELAELGD